MSHQIANTARVHAGVVLGGSVVIEDFCIIGAQSRNVSDAYRMTEIGDNACIRSHVVIYAGNRIGRNFQAGNKANIRELNDIGDHVSIGTLSVVEHHVCIEDYVRIHSQVFIPEYSIIRQGAWIGPNVVLTNARYPNAPDAKKSLQGPVIEAGAKIGANVTILPGVIIGRNALVGAGAVVTRNVPENAVVAGNPARVVNKIDNLPYPA